MAMQETIDVLMVEDNRGDVVLVQEAVAKAALPYRIRVAPDGAEAVAYLRRQGQFAAAPRPEMIVLDLKLPRMNGREAGGACQRKKGVRCRGSGVRRRWSRRGEGRRSRASGERPERGGARLGPICADI